MTSSSTQVRAPSTDVVLYDPTLPHVAMGSRLEKVTNEAYRRSFEIAKYEATHFPQAASNFTGRNFVYLSSLHLTLAKGLKTDSSIEIEIFAPVLGNKRPSILIFSHGMVTDPVHYRPLLGELASHGYVVLSITHRSALDKEGERDALGYVMANTIRYVLAQVQNGALKRVVGDTDKIFLGGHSLGGAASINVARNNRTVAGCVNLDGFLHGKTKTARVVQPLLMIIGDHEGWIKDLKQHPPDQTAKKFANDCSDSLKEYETLKENSVRAEKIVIPEARHEDFTDDPFQSYLRGEQSIGAAMRVHTIVSQKMLKFMHDGCV